MGKWTKVTPTTLPTPGERVLICVGEVFVGEGWLRENRTHWVRYDELPTVDEIFSPACYSLDADACSSWW